MNDLRNGIIDINGFLLEPTTTIEDMEEYFGMPGIRKGICCNFTLNEQTFINNGLEFKIDVSFDETVDEVKLYPQIPELISKYKVREVIGGLAHEQITCDIDNDLAYFKEVRAVLDEWLEKQLGEPTFCDCDCTEYSFKNVFIYTCAYEENGRSLWIHGGCLKISYED